MKKQTGIRFRIREKLFLYFLAKYENDIGLMIFKEIVEKYGGKIRIGSGSGKGTAVHFVLPV
ncbi:MAG: hypothetical protein DRP85_07070 [Candidatus Makaraimicrobium thalassicum]|nr:MAG: hypothetical protein DRP85_07070 [Candidatus Omnitrophota bacterium]